MALFVAIRAAMPIALPYNSANPWKLIAAVPAELRSQPVINGYSMGGPLILSGIRPYVHGRGDMFGDELVTGYKNILEGIPRRSRRRSAAGESAGRSCRCIPAS